LAEFGVARMPLCDALPISAVVDVMPENLAALAKSFQNFALQ